MTKRNVSRLFPVLCLLLAWPDARAHAAGDAIQLFGRFCRDLPRAQFASLPPAWQRWTRWPHLVQLCPLTTTRTGLVWSVLTLRYDRFDDAGVPDAQTRPEVKLPPDPYPTPLILDPAGAIIGDLPEPFPTKGLGFTRVMVSDWRDGFPHRIDVSVIGGWNWGAYPVPSRVWNDSSRRYEPAPWPR